MNNSLVKAVKHSISQYGKDMLADTTRLKGFFCFRRGEASPLAPARRAAANRAALGGLGHTPLFWGQNHAAFCPQAPAAFF
jgi:hypothetical protein